MSIADVLIISLVSFLTSIFTVSVGGTSIVTVPLLIWLGMAPKNAIATNMLALIFLSASGAAGLRNEWKPGYGKIIMLFSAITMLGSFAGAHFVLSINEVVLKKVLGIIICIVAAVIISAKNLGIRKSAKKPSRTKLAAATLSVFMLGIYGGFFSGGYVTLLSYVFMLVFGFNFLGVALITKILNVFSSFVACALFYRRGLINFSVGVPLAVSMLGGGLLGAKLAIAEGDLWIRRVFIAALTLLAGKLLFF